MNSMPSGPLEAVTHPDPYPYYAKLASEHPFYFDSSLDLWVASSASAVTEVLSNESLGVRPPDEPVPNDIVGSPTGRVFQHLVRMTDGDRHQKARPSVKAALAAVSPRNACVVAREVAGLTAGRLKLAHHPERINQFIFQVPVGVVARLSGLAEADLEVVAKRVEDFVDAVKPGSSAMARDAGDGAAGYLIDGLHQVSAREAPTLLEELTNTLDREVALANAIGLLMQSYEATAGLIGNTLVMMRKVVEGDDSIPDIDAAFVREVARYDSPVQNTRRFAASDCSIQDEQVLRGQGVLVILAAANRDPAVNPLPSLFQPEREAPGLYTFGLGAHHCPGMNLAVQITVEAVAVLLKSGISPDSLPYPCGYIPSANARIPRFSA